MADYIPKKVILNTPLGALSFKAKCRNGHIQDSQITFHKWEPSIPSGMSVDGCYVVLFKNTSSEQIDDFELSCSWVDLNVKGHPCSGEALDAWEWESGKTLVLVGTEDTEWLHSRLNINKKYSPENYPITMENNTVSIRIDEFGKNKELSLHFVVSWNTLPEQVDNSCWFAVDISHEKILEQHNKLTRHSTRTA